MGREIRRVPPNWEHPKRSTYDYIKRREVESYQPMLNNPYIVEIEEWIKDHNLWAKGEHPDQLEDSDTSKYEYYAQYGGNPPDVEYYRPNWKPEEMTWYQMYETVSEGTPVTPPFETKKELVDYLVINGDFWDQKNGHGRWNRENTERFVSIGWAPSSMLNTTTGTYHTPRDMEYPDKVEEG